MSNAKETADAELHRQTAVPGALHRLALSAAMAIGSSFYVTAWFGAGYFAAVLAYEIIYLKFVGPAFLLKHLDNDSARFQRNATIIVLIAATVYALGWAPALMLGTSGAAFFAALSIAGVVVHNVLYLGDPRLFAASLAPPALAAAVIPFLRYAQLEATVLALSVVVLIATAVVALLERMRLLQVFMAKETERQRAEAANGAKSDFLATMSHELRTPLNAVIGYAEILEEDLADKGEQTSAADAATIGRSARALLTLINEVLDFSKIEAGRMELSTSQTDVGAILSGVVETTRHIAKANDTTIELFVEPNVGVLEIDGQRLRQCALNLVSNACKFTSKGTVSVRAAINEERQLAINVTDTGSGIAPEDLDRLFQPFVQADGSTRKHEGTGLGLAITRKLAQLMGGDVRCESTVGVGSTFTLTIATNIAKEAEGDGPLVLVVDDNPDHRALVQRSAELLPVRVRGVSNAADALDAVKRERPALILLDINLPHASGWTVLQELNNSPSPGGTAIVVCTVEDAEQRAKALGADGFLAKPIDRVRLAATIARWALRPAVEADLAA